jgi:DNA-directed RNA polymerase subunit L
MKVSNIVENNNDMQFVLSGVDTSIANGLRRTLLSDIPSVVMKTMPQEKCQVTFTSNTTKFHNEILKQRLACIPVHITDLGPHIEQLEIEVDLENDTSENIYLTTEDFKIKNLSTGQYLKTDDVKNIFPPNPQTGYYIDVARLRPKLTPDGSGEKVSFKARLSIGTADENSMYNAVSTSVFGNTQDEDKIGEQYKVKEQELKDAGLSQENIAFELKNWKIMDAQRIYLKNSFDFDVKTVGVFTCKELLKIACDRLVEKMDRLIGEISNDKKKNAEGVVIEKTSSTLENGYDVKLYNEDYTIGQILQYLLYSMHYQGDKTMNFCGFKKLHPHDPFILGKISYIEETAESVLVDDLIGALNAAKVIYKDLKEMF